jgi:putative ABC transport system permease protein
MLPEGMEPAYLSDKLTEFNNRMREIIHESYPDHWFNPVKNIYFELGKFDYSQHGNLLTVQMFLAAAILIIIIACINFINLSTARAMIRAREIGIRKVVGAHKKNLVLQFLGESVLISLLAGLIALVILEIIYPHFANFFSMTSELHTWKNYVFFLGGMILIGLISGIYPAFYLASSVPVEVLRGEKTSGSRGATFRKILTVFQFAISIILIAGTLIVQKQLRYIQNRDMGFNKEQILTFRIPSGCYDGKRDVFQQEILSIPGVKTAAYLYTTPGRVILQWGYTDEEGNTHEFRTIPTDPEFINVFEIPLVEGSNWDWERDPQDQGVIVNEAFVKMMNWENPLEEMIWGEMPIQGVMKDFIYRTFHFEIEPLLILWDWEQTYSMSVKLAGNDIQNTISQIEKKYNDFEAENTFDFYFLDEDFERYYRAEIRFGKIFTYFSLLAIFVACLGLFGLAAFMTSQRTKEIGIRKVMGSSVGQLVKLLAYDSVKWVLVANVIAWPVCWLVMNKWLEKFVFRTEIDIFLLLMAGVLALLIALITVIYHTYRSASANPVEALKYE